MTTCTRWLTAAAVSVSLSTLLLAQAPALDVRMGVWEITSTIDIGGILSNVANKFLLEGFFSVERVWRRK